MSDTGDVMGDLHLATVVINVQTSLSCATRTAASSA
jgi:hypothetical protein